MFAAKEGLDRLVIFREVEEVIPFLGNGRKEVQSRLNLNNRLHQSLPTGQNTLARIMMLLVMDFQTLDLINRVLRIALEVLHDGIFVLRRSSGAEGLLHHIPDSLFVLIADADTLFHQELFRKRFFGDEADDLFLALVIQADRSTIDCESEISALEQTRHQPMHIIFHKAIRSLHEAVLHRFHGGFHVIAGIHGDKALHIVQRMSIALCATFQPKRKLVALMEHLADLRLAHRRVDVGQLVIDRLHQTANGFIDPADDFLAVHADNIAVYIDRCFFQRFGQVELCVLIALPHFHTLCLFDRLILGKLRGGVFPKEPLNFQIGLNFRQELCIIRKYNKDFSALTGHHPKGSILCAAVVPRCQDTKADVIVLICFVWTIIYKLVEAKGIAAIEDRIGVAFAGENVLKNHFRDLGDDLRRFYIFLLNFIVDFLFLIGQEDIDAAVFLHEHLPHQDLQRFLHTAFQLNPVIVDIFNHQAGDVVDVCLNFQHIFDHEECLEDIDGEDILVLLLRVDIAVVISPDDHPAVAVIQKVFQCVIKAMEGYNDPCLFIHDIDGGFLKKRQHGALTAGKVFTGSPVGTNRSQYAGQQIELVRHKGVDLGKVFRTRVQLLFCRIIEHN